MAVKFTNNASTTLTSDVDVGHTSIAVANVSSFPDISSSGYYYITIGTEVIKVTAVSGTTLTIDAATVGHDNGDGVELRVTAEVLEDVRTETTNLATGTSAGTICAGDDGRLSNARAPTTHSHNHDDLSSIDANEHLDWTTDQGATNIHAGNYAPATSTAFGSVKVSLSGTHLTITI